MKQSNKQFYLCDLGFSNRQEIKEEKQSYLKVSTANKFKIKRNAFKTWHLQQCSVRTRNRKPNVRVEPGTENRMFGAKPGTKNDSC